MNKRSTTTQRSLVLEAVKEFRCHVTADEVYNTIVTDLDKKIKDT